MLSPRRPTRLRGFAGRKQIAGGGNERRKKIIGADEKLRKKRERFRKFSNPQFPMPSFDIVSEIDNQEIDNALNQARKELATRFDFKGSVAGIEYEKDTITLTAEDASRLRGLREIVIGKLSKRGIDLRNIDQKVPAISSIGHARQEMKIQQGLEGDKAKEIILAIKGGGFKVQNQLQDRQIRVTGKKRDELQEVIAFVKSKDFGVATNFKNFRD